MRRLISFLLIISVLFSLSAETTITILGTSDLHGNIWGYSYEDSKETDNNGMARLYTYIESVREENPNTILIDAGDDIQGTIMTDDIYNKTPDAEHPVIAAMNYMGYEAMTLGNHEFNWGTDTAAKILSQADFPILAANVRNQDGSYATGLGWIIIPAGGVDVAVIGVITPNVPIWDGGKEGIGSLTFLPANEAVKEAITEIGDKADVIIVSAHMGLESEFDTAGQSDSAQKILEENPEIDVLQVAHDHVTVAEKRGDTVIGGVRDKGREIVRFDITLDDGKRIIDSSVMIVSMEGTMPSEEIASIPAVAQAHEKTLRFMNGDIAIGETTEAFQTADEIVGIPETRIRDSAVLDLINEVQRGAADADVSMTVQDTISLPEGPITYAEIFSIYRFDNNLYRVRVTGAELKALLEWSASCYNQWTPGDINISFNHDFPQYLADVFSGIDYEIDLSKRAGERVRNVIFKGRELADDAVLTLACNSYRYSSVLKAQNIVSAEPEWESEESIRDLLIDYFAENSPVSPSVDNNWRIVGIDLCENDFRRKEMVALINSGLVEPPYWQSLRFSDYDEIVASIE